MRYKLSSIGVQQGAGKYRGIVDTSPANEDNLGLSSDELAQLRYLFLKAFSSVSALLVEGKRVRLFDTFTIECGLSGSVDNNLGTFSKDNVEVRLKPVAAFEASVRRDVYLEKDSTPSVGPYVSGLMTDRADYVIENGLIQGGTFTVRGGGLKGLSGMILQNKGDPAIPTVDITPFVARVTDTRVVGRVPYLGSVLETFRPQEVYYNSVRLLFGDANVDFDCEFAQHDPSLVSQDSIWHPVWGGPVLKGSTHIMDGLTSNYFPFTIPSMVEIVTDGIGGYDVNGYLRVDGNYVKYCTIHRYFVSLNLDRDSHGGTSGGLYFYILAAVNPLPEAVQDMIPNSSDYLTGGLMHVLVPTGLLNFMDSQGSVVTAFNTIYLPPPV